MSIRLVVADDHEVVRRGIACLLQDAGIEVVGEAETVSAALEMTRALKPDVLLLDVRLPDSGGLKVLAQIRNESPDQPVLMFSGYDNPTYISHAVALGANGFVAKGGDLADLVASIREAAEGRHVWPIEQLRRIRGLRSVAHLPANLEVTLTQREAQILRQVSEGMTNRTIAADLGISHETVKEHVRHLLRKIGVNDRTQASVWAVRQGIL